MSRRTLYGWGRTAPSMADVVTASSEEQVAALFSSSAHVLARGLGRSYGDAAQLGGGTVLDNHELGGISAITPTGEVTAGAGVSIDELLQLSIPKGWFVPVTPGTRQVSLGGAFSADVHGKNHHRDGSFSQHVTSLRLVTPSGVFTCSPHENADIFWATAGGMGLTGIITSLTLQLIPIETDQILVDTQRFNSLDGVMSALEASDDDYKYSVAWVDCMTKGSHMGRGILTRGDHAAASEVEKPTRHAPRPAKLSVPFDAPSGLLNPLTIKAFNELWFRVAPQEKLAQPQSLSSFFHPLDGIGNWNRLYGKRGFVQYQFCVPDAAGDTVVRAINRLSSSGVPSFLAVLKRFGAANQGLLSFPSAGWTLALDLPVGPAALPEVLDDLDEMVLEAGGRIYFAKDARLSPDKVAAMYPKLGEFQELKKRLDPAGQLTSDLARRLHLVGK